MDEKLDYNIDRFFNGPYFCLPKKMCTLCGLWPFHPLSKISHVLWGMSCWFIVMPQVYAIKVNSVKGDWGAVMGNALMSFVQFAVFMKLFTMVIAQEKSLHIYYSIMENWSRITDPEEKEILITYARRGRLINIGYICFQGFVYTAFIIGPAVPAIINRLQPDAPPKTLIYILGGEYFVENKDEIYGFIYSWELVHATIVLCVAGPVDIMYACCVEHSLSMHAIICHRLVKLQYSVETNDKLQGTDNSYQYMVDIIKLHQITLDFTINLEDSYSLCFLAMIWLHLLFIPLICVLIIMNIRDPVNLIRFSLFFGTAVVHLLNMFVPGQRLINHSDEVEHSALNNNWFTCPQRTKILLRMFVLRCQQPALITGGGLMLLSIQNFSGIIKSALSYVTVFSSFR